MRGACAGEHLQPSTSSQTIFSPRSSTLIAKPSMVLARQSLLMVAVYVRYALVEQAAPLRERLRIGRGEGLPLGIFAHRLVHRHRDCQRDAR